MVSTKAKTLVERYGDAYVCIGPWLLANPESEESFREEAGFESFCDLCREQGVPVRVGRWNIPSSPRTILVEFSSLFEKKDGILAGLWERYGVDSITGGWDYDEPVLFGHAVGLVIELWYQEYLAASRGVAIAQFHEWMTGSGLLQLKHTLPVVGTVFTTHATMLGRSLSSTGRRPEEGLEGRTPEEAAEDVGIRSKHSMETICAREADVFTTVSDITGAEAELFYERKPDPLLPNGIDLDVIDELAAGIDRAQARAALENLARRFVGEDCSGAAFLLLSGRYEFHNKGIDVLLEAMAKVNEREGRDVVLLLTVPAGQSGICKSVRERMEAPLEDLTTPLGVSTHNLIDRDDDPIQRATKRLGLTNQAGSRVKVIQIPIYLSKIDGLLNMPYEAMLGGVDLTCFPSFYEPWGYTPEESLAVGVPTVTTDLAGFGRWALGAGLGPQNGVFVLKRDGVEDADATADLAEMIETFLVDGVENENLYEICRHTARRTAWSDLIANYDRAFEGALEKALERAEQAPPPPLRPVHKLPVADTPDRKSPRLFPFDVSATVPTPLHGLQRLAANYYWCWDPEGQELFEELSPVSWASCDHNPTLLLRVVFPEDLDAKASDADYLAKLERVLARFDAYMATKADPVELEGGYRVTPQEPVAYFCAEYGIHESLRIYSGGLGILAGDHLKSASDLDFPLVAVGLFYQFGYLRQRTSPAGEQIELDSANDPRKLPLQLVRDPAGEPVEISIQLPSSTLWLRAWKVGVGRVDLYLLDANLEKNRAEDRAITHQLYGGDHEARLRQEIVLGRAGVLLLSRIGIRPSVFHINEGHAAFLAIERVAALVREEGLTFDEAREMVRATTLFTTHTPVPAGHDRFGEDLMRRYFSDVPERIGVDWKRLLDLGRTETDPDTFNMTYLALNFAGFANGVSKLHAEVSKDLLQPFWPGLLRAELPINAVTNGIHLATWTRSDLGALMGAADRPVVGGDFAKRAPRVDLRQLWMARERARAHLLDHARANLERSSVERHDSPLALARILDGLDPGALMIGFARRFAPYKRADLIFKDRDRLVELLHDDERPLRIFFAGKAHPRDEHGKQILQSIVELTRSEEFQGRIFFLEDYDIELARALVQGVDVWLNNPIRTLEASGTSGMKAAANAVLNLSVPDGWWVEGYDGQNGWSIGDGRVYQNQDLQDELDSANLCRLLQDDVLPLFFDRDDDGVPLRWLERVRNTLETIPAEFNTDRMVGEYLERAYLPMATRGFTLAADNRTPLKQHVLEHQRIRRGFEAVQIVAAHLSDLTRLNVGDRIDGRVEVDLGELQPADVVVELVLGHTRGEHDLRNVTVVRLQPAGDREEGVVTFEGTQEIARSGSFAYGVRVRARERGTADIGLRDLVVWA